MYYWNFSSFYDIYYMWDFKIFLNLTKIYWKVIKNYIYLVFFKFSKVISDMLHIRVKWLRRDKGGSRDADASKNEYLIGYWKQVLNQVLQTSPWSIGYLIGYIIWCPIGLKVYHYTNARSLEKCSMVSAIKIWTSILWWYFNDVGTP